jgi:hypothetical protein
MIKIIKLYIISVIFFSVIVYSKNTDSLFTNLIISKQYQVSSGNPDNITRNIAIEEILKKSIVPIIKVESITGRNNWILKYPVGTAFLIVDSTGRYVRFFLATAKHVIENDSATICLMNFAEKNNPEISSIIRKYVIKRNEWKFHTGDSIKINRSIKYSGYDVAIAEIFLFRVEQNNSIIWNQPINIKMLEPENDREKTAKVIAFPFVNRFSMEKGLTMGDLEVDSGMITHRIYNEILFDKDRIVKDLNELAIMNPKFRRGYSGGLVFSGNVKPSVIGMAMGMSSVREYGNGKLCFAFFVRADNILKTINDNFKNNESH